MSDIDRTKIRQLDFTLLLIMQGLLRHRRTVEVASELGLSQPAISHALRRLRELFGDPLFIRKPHGFTPTHHALALAPLVESMLEHAHDAVGLVDSFDPETTTRDFRVASPDLLGPLIVTPLLKQFERQAPRARFALRTMIGEEAIRAVHQDQLDVAIGQFGRIDAGMQVSHLYDDQYVVVTRANHPLASRAMTRKTLTALQFVTISATGALRGLTDDELEHHGVYRHIVASVPRFSTALEIVRKTNAAFLAPRRLAENYAGPFRLALHELPVRLSPFRVLLLHRTNPDPGREWLANLIVDALTEDRS